MRCGFMVADGSKGGILLMWDSRVRRFFCRPLSGVYAPHTAKEKLNVGRKWPRMKRTARAMGRGDFNTNAYMLERRGCSRTTNIMADFSKWIKILNYMTLF
ncbi:hypothetical protein H5410_034843 [Solanum commersonii]|uniref:Uncharacterized protein n=1 Tax=Solanum commersonii TaxID=4109 RepID=A0A9J5XZ28_SOLCO|nr:hypothetical protein H5410_034843 [Solanum commersonii]